MTETCPGPLLWFELDDDPERPAAILECNACGYIIATGWFHDDAHAGTPLLRSYA